jgi:hypothetical protein
MTAEPITLQPNHTYRTLAQVYATLLPSRILFRLADRIADSVDIMTGEQSQIGATVYTPLEDRIDVERDEADPTRGKITLRNASIFLSGQDIERRIICLYSAEGFKVSKDEESQIITATKGKANYQITVETGYNPKRDRTGSRQFAPDSYFIRIL